MRLKRIIKILFAAIVILAAWIVFNTQYAWRDYVFGPPVEFIKNEFVELGLYPRGLSSATVFTNDDYCQETPFPEARRLREWLLDNSLNMTFFVIPCQQARSPLVPGEHVEFLKQLEVDGHEVAQHGYAHYCSRNLGTNLKAGAEMALLDCRETVEILAKGKNLLEELGFNPVGHRSPCFSGTEETFVALDELGFLYGSDRHLPAKTIRNFLLPLYRGRIIYPYHPQGMGLLEITGQIDPTVDLKKAKKVFERFHPRGGVIVYLTHLPHIGQPENLARLGEFLEYVRKHDTWICRMDELARWWLARERITVETATSGDTLLINISNPTGYLLADAVLSIEKKGPFRVQDSSGNILEQGFGPAEILLNIPPSPQ